MTLNDDDAFADGDDDTDMASAFTREAIRKELERHLPPPLDPTWEEVDSDHNTASTTGAFFKDRDSNTSVSTLDINGGTYGQPGEWTSPTVESPPSTHFSQILTSTKTEVHSDSEDSPTRPASDPEEPKTPEQQEERPYPSVVIDAPTHRVTLTSEIKPHTPSVSVDGSSAAIAVATAVANTQLPTSSSSTPASTSRTQVSESLPSSSSLPSSKPTPLFEKPYNHKYNRSGGPSAFEKVRSKTRPTFLPPKPRQEDDKHMADWQHMMKQSRVAGACFLFMSTSLPNAPSLAEKRRKALQDRRLLREKAVEESLHIWEREIVPDWRVVHKNPQLRKLWWRGIPAKLRASMWEKAVGNPLALSKGTSLLCYSISPKC
jgi:hypothetical protein